MLGGLDFAAMDWRVGAGSLAPSAEQLVDGWLDDCLCDVSFTVDPQNSMLPRFPPPLTGLEQRDWLPSRLVSGGVPHISRGAAVNLAGWACDVRFHAACECSLLGLLLSTKYDDMRCRATQ
jgi:hypothetical protein